MKLGDDDFFLPHIANYEINTHQRYHWQTKLVSVVHNKSGLYWYCLASMAYSDGSVWYSSFVEARRTFPDHNLTWGRTLIKAHIDFLRCDAFDLKDSIRGNYKTDYFNGQTYDIMCHPNAATLETALKQYKVAIEMQIGLK